MLIEALQIHRRQMVVFFQQIHIKGRLGVQGRALSAQQDGEADDGNGMSRAVAHRDIRLLVRRNGSAKRLHSAKIIQNAPAHLAGAGLAGQGVLFTAVRGNTLCSSGVFWFWPAQVSVVIVT